MPFGPNRPWLNGGGIWAALLEDWRGATSFTGQSGTPYTPRVTALAADVARGTNGTLRADYDGGAVQVSDPDNRPVLQHRRVRPARAGDIRQREPEHDHRAGQSAAERAVLPRRALPAHARDTIQVNATNLLNMVNYAAIDTVVNSPTFGQVLSVRPMRSMQATVRFRF